MVPLAKKRPKLPSFPLLLFRTARATLTSSTKAYTLTHSISVHDFINIMTPYSQPDEK
jgi:hypothetical protein